MYFLFIFANRTASKAATNNCVINCHKLTLLFSRERPPYSDSCFAAVENLAHSSGVNAFRIDPAVSHRAVTVLAALARKRP